MLLVLAKREQQWKRNAHYIKCSDVCMCQRGLLIKLFCNQRSTCWSLRMLLSSVCVLPEIHNFAFKNVMKGGYSRRGVTRCYWVKHVTR